MADIGDLTHRQTDDLGNKMGGMTGIKRFLSGELVLVERNILQQSAVTPQDFDNGGVTFEESILNIEAFLDDQAKFLREVLGVGMPSRKKLKLPNPRPGFGWGIVRVPGLPAQRMLNILKPRFDGKLWQWCNNIDDALDPKKEARTVAKGPYVVFCRARREADEEHKNQSANDLVNLGINCMTEPERIQLEGWFHWKKGNHLDLKNVTLSVGSRYLDGHVPSAGWDSHGGFYVGGCDADGRAPGIRAREVVSL